MRSKFSIVMKKWDLVQVRNFVYFHKILKIFIEDAKYTSIEF